jgi:hypothetical protein
MSLSSRCCHPPQQHQQQHQQHPSSSQQSCSSHSTSSIHTAAAVTAATAATTFTITATSSTGTNTALLCTRRLRYRAAFQKIEEASLLHRSLHLIFQHALATFERLIRYLELPVSPCWSNTYDMIRRMHAEHTLHATFVDSLLHSIGMSEDQSVNDGDNQQQLQQLQQQLQQQPYPHHVLNRVSHTHIEYAFPELSIVPT